MRCLPALGLLLIGAPLPAQTSPAPLSRAAATISAADVARRVGIIADDSMMGRDTPSRGLDLTAQYVADEFRRFGLRPGGDDSTWFQRYPITRRRLDLEKSLIVFASGSTEREAGLATAARMILGDVPRRPVAGPAVLVGGPVSPESAAQLDVRGKIVLLPFGAAALAKPEIERGARILYNQGPKALLLLADLDSAAFRKKIPGRARERIVVGGGGDEPPALEVSTPHVAQALEAAGIDLSAARSARSTGAREVPGLAVRIDLRDSVISALSAPNTVGILEGGDPKLKHEYIVYSAHMDHIGITPSRADSINNGADDNASGTAGVIELAEAFSRAGARPKRSIIFLTVSGEEKGLWGSNYFVSHPAVPLERIVANINMDMIGRNWRDTIVAIGQEHSDLGATLARVNAAHPELGMTAIDDLWPEERFYFRSDHYNFARKGVPALFFFNGVHDDYHEVTDSPEKIDSEKQSRVLRLLFYLGQEVANAPRRPQWKPESYREIVE